MLHGGVVVNAAGGGLELEVKMDVVVNGDLAGDDILVDKDSEVGNAFYFSSAIVKKNATVGGPFQVPDLLPLVTPPPFQTGAPSVDVVTVGPATTLTLDPGTYGHLTIAGTGILRLSGGTYDFASIVATAGGGGPCGFPCRSILALGPSDVRVEGTFDIGKDALVGTTPAAMVSPWDLRFFVDGTNGDPLDPDSLPPAARVGKDSSLSATIYAPQGTVAIHKAAQGAVWLIGLDVRVDKDTVFRLPPAASDVAVSVSEDGPPVVGAFDAEASDGSTLTYTVVDDPALGTVVNNLDGTFTYDPGLDFQGLDDGEPEDVLFTYIAKDVGGVATNTATVTVTVIGDSDGVTAVDDMYSTDESTGLAVAAPGLLGNDDDPDGTATVLAIVDGQSALGGGVDISPDGSFSYDPDDRFDYLAVGESADDSFQYTAVNSISSSSAAATVTVTGVNDSPVTNNGGAFGSGAFVITVSGSDPDLSDDLEVTGASVILGTLGAITNFDGTGSEDKNTATIAYTAPAGDPEDTLTFTMVDGNGGTSVGTITINQDPGTEPPDDPPSVVEVEAKDDTVETNAGEAIDIVLNGSARTEETTTPIGDLTFSPVTAPPVAEGTLSAIVDDVPDPLPLPDPTPAARSAQVTFIPAGGFTGTTSFVFRACEVAVPANCDTATVTIHVEPEAAPVEPVVPTVRDISKTLEESDTVSFSLTEGVVTTGADESCDEPGNPCGRTAQRNALSSLADAAGDSGAGEPDLVSIDVGITAGIDNVAFDVRFDPGTFDSATSRATFVINIDRNPATGFPGVDAANNDATFIGNEYLIDVGANLGATAVIKRWVSGTTAPATYVTVATVPATVLGDGYHVAFDLELLGDDDGFFSYKVLTQRYIGPGFTGIQDYMSDIGSLPGDINPDSNTVDGGVTYRLLTLPSSGTLLDSEGLPFTTAPVSLFTASGLTFVPDAIGSVSFDFEVRNTALLTTVATVAFEIVVQGTCVSDPTICEDGRA